MRWKDLAQVYESELRTQHPGVTVFSTKTDEGNQRWKDLKIRVVEHVSTKYTLQNCESQPCRETSYYAELLKTSAFVLCFKWYKVVMFNCKCLCFYLFVCACVFSVYAYMCACVFLFKWVCVPCLYGSIFRFQNIRVMAKYYTRVQMKRMSALLDLTEAVSTNYS